MSEGLGEWHWGGAISVFWLPLYYQTVFRSGDRSCLHRVCNPAALMPEASHVCITEPTNSLSDPGRVVPCCLEASSSTLLLCSTPAGVANFRKCPGIQTFDPSGIAFRRA